MLKNRWFLSVAVLAELAAIYGLYQKYRDIEAKILLVQGQFPERYANLHAEWLQVAGGIVLVTLLLPFTVYVLVRKKR